MSDIFDKCRSWKDYRIAQATGLYPYYRAIEGNHGGTEVEVEGRRFLMVGSNDYLGLASDPRLKQAAREAVDRFGTTCSGSRLLNGNLSLHEELETRLARFLGREAALVVSTGFQGNLSLSCLLARQDWVFTDRQNHASLVDGMRLAYASEKRYRHQDMQHLEHLLAAAPADAAKMIVTDGVFSMEGDVCNLPRITELARRYQARVVVDDAHALGVLGESGRGTTEHFGLEAETDLLTGTFSKSFASLGGVLAGKAQVIHYLRHKARPVLFSAAMPPASVAAALCALEIVEKEPERRTRLLDIAERVHNGLRALGFDTGFSSTPIVPVHMGDQLRCFRFWKALFEEGIFVNPIIPPAVEPGHALLRMSFMATHSDAQIDRLLETFERVGRRLGVIPQTRPTVFNPVHIARPGSELRHSHAASRRVAASASVMSQQGLSLESISRLSSREMADKLFDLVELVTYRAANLEPEDLARMKRAPLRIWSQRQELALLALEKGTHLFSHKGRSLARS